MKFAEDNNGISRISATLKSAAKVVAGTVLLLSLAVVSIVYGVDLVAGGHRYCMRAAQTEAKHSLRSIYDAQQKYHVIHGEYGRTFDEIGYNGTDRQYPHYMIYMGSDMIEASHAVGDTTFPNWLRRTESSKREFVAYAIANQDTDNTLDIWMIDSRNELINLVDDVDN